MYITGKRLSRRALLRGAGATLGLPFLDAMTPALRAAQAPPRRLVYVYVPNGIIMQHWTPAATGAGFELPRLLAPLASYRDRLTVVTGLAHKTGMDLNGDSTGPHARAAATYLTGVRPKKTAGADIQLGISADQVAAARLGSATKYASLELGCEDSRVVGNCEAGYSCAYTNSISWRGPNTPMPPETNPRALFERLFGARGETPEKREERRLFEKSILDFVTEDARRLSTTLGPKDRQKLDEYLTGVRTIEKRVQDLSQDPGLSPDFEKPDGIPADFAEYVRLMFDMLFVALQSDLTRIATFMVGKELSFRTYREIGIGETHHALSHHRNNPEWIEKVSQINAFHMRQFVYFVDRLARSAEGDRTLLDNMMLVYGSSLSDGNLHDHLNLPALILGSGGGAIKAGRHLRLAGDPPMTNLHLALLDFMGVRTESLGDSTGAAECLTGLTA